MPKFLPIEGDPYDLTRVHYLSFQFVFFLCLLFLRINEIFYGVGEMGNSNSIFVNWSVVCSPIKTGGLGVRNLQSGFVVR